MCGCLPLHPPSPPTHTHTHNHSPSASGSLVAAAALSPVELGPPQWSDILDQWRRMVGDSGKLISLTSSSMRITMLVLSTSQQNWGHSPIAITPTSIQPSLTSPRSCLTCLIPHFCLFGIINQLNYFLKSHFLRAYLEETQMKTSIHFHWSFYNYKIIW